MVEIALDRFEELRRVKSENCGACGGFGGAPVGSGCLPRREFAVAGRRPGRLSLAIAAGFIARCDLAVGGKRSKFRLICGGAPLAARSRGVPLAPFVAGGWLKD